MALLLLLPLLSLLLLLARASGNSPPPPIPPPRYPAGSEADPYARDEYSIDATAFEAGGADFFVQAPGIDARVRNATGRAASDLYLALAAAAAAAAGRAAPPASETNGTYALTTSVALQTSPSVFRLPQTVSDRPCARLAFFRGQLRAVGLVAYCPGRPAWGLDPMIPKEPVEAYTAEARRVPFPCGFPLFLGGQGDPWPAEWPNGGGLVNASDAGADGLAPRRPRARGAALASDDGGRSWRATAADPRLARCDANLVALRGADGSEDAALCLVGGQFLGAPGADATTRNALKMLDVRLLSASRAVTCSYDAETWWDAAELPIGVAMAGAVAVNSTVVLAGGLYSNPFARAQEFPPTYNSSAEPFEPGSQPMFVSVTRPDPTCAGAAAADGAGGTPRLPDGGASACLNISDWAAFASPWTPQGQPPPAPRIESLWHRSSPSLVWVEGPAWFCDPSAGDAADQCGQADSWAPRLMLSGGFAEGAFPYVTFDDAWELRGAANLSTVIAAAAAAAAARQPSAGSPLSADWWPLPQLSGFEPSSLRPPTQSYPSPTFLMELQWAPGASLTVSNGLYPGNPDFAHFQPVFLSIVEQALSVNALASNFRALPTVDLTNASMVALASSEASLMYSILGTPGLRSADLPSLDFKRFPPPPGTNATYMDLRTACDRNFGVCSMFVSSAIAVASPRVAAGQPVVFVLQGGKRVVAVYFSRCFMPVCAPGTVSRTCQRDPFDAVCVPCEACGGGGARGGGGASSRSTYLERNCTSVLQSPGRLPAVFDEQCAACTVCGADADADYVSRCSATADSVCAAPALPGSGGVPGSSLGDLFGSPALRDLFAQLGWALAALTAALFAALAPAARAKLRRAALPAAAVEWHRALRPTPAASVAPQGGLKATAAAAEAAIAPPPGPELVLADARARAPWAALRFYAGACCAASTLALALALPPGHVLALAALVLPPLFGARAAWSAAQQIRGGNPKPAPAAEPPVEIGINPLGALSGGGGGRGGMVPPAAPSGGACARVFGLCLSLPRVGLLSDELGALALALLHPLCLASLELLPPGLGPFARAHTGAGADADALAAFARADRQKNRNAAARGARANAYWLCALQLVLALALALRAAAPAFAVLCAVAPAAVVVVATAAAVRRELKALCEGRGGAKGGEAARLALPAAAMPPLQPGAAMGQQHLVYKELSELTSDASVSTRSGGVNAGSRASAGSSNAASSTSPAATASTGDPRAALLRALPAAATAIDVNEVRLVDLSVDAPSLLSARSGDSWEAPRDVMGSDSRDSRASSRVGSRRVSLAASTVAEI